MDREQVMKVLERILDIHGVNLFDRKPILDDLYEVVYKARCEGYCSCMDSFLKK